MFTLKFHMKNVDSWKVYSTNQYEVQRYTDSREVIFTPDGSNDEVNVTIGENYWDVCYIVNSAGETVDRVHP